VRTLGVSETKHSMAEMTSYSAFMLRGKVVVVFSLKKRVAMARGGERMKLATVKTCLPVAEIGKSG